MGGMMPMQERKINPTTGMSMNTGGITDMGESGTFYPHPLKPDLRDAFAEAGKKLSTASKIGKSGMFYGGMAAKKKSKMMYGGMASKKK